MYSVVVVVIVLAVGTEGMVLLEHWSYVEAFYFMSLLATTQGPAGSPATDAGKVFAALMSFVSVGAVLSSVVFVFGPVLGTVLKVGFDYLEREERRIKDRVEHKK